MKMEMGCEMHVLDTTIVTQLYQHVQQYIPLQSPTSLPIMEYLIRWLFGLPVCNEISDTCLILIGFLTWTLLGVTFAVHTIHKHKLNAAKVGRI